jgi:uncharacterized repeat protein (TIGR03803 family)
MQGPRARFLAVLFAIGLASPAASQPPVPPAFEVLRTWDNPPTRPLGGLVEGDGGLYGTSQGGDFARGTIFRLALSVPGATPSIEKVYSFTDAEFAQGRSGAVGQLLRASNGDLYGMRARGYDYTKGGSVFRLSASGVLTTIHDIDSADGVVNDYLDGQGPLVEKDQVLYGVLYYGGTGNRGALFRVGLDGSGYEVFHRFEGPDGDRPEGGLLPLGDWLYGTTAMGGANSAGTLFRIHASSGELQTLHHFILTEGARPRGALALGPDGLLYGAATARGLAGCGSVFSVDPNPPHAIVFLHSFACGSGPEGTNPEGGMVVLAGPGGEPVIFGVATAFSNPGVSAVYRLSPGGPLTVLSTSSWSDRCSSQLRLASDGFIYGQCHGNQPPDAGRVFRVDPTSGTVTTVLRFGRQEGGRIPHALIEGRDGQLYGSMRFGGAQNRGSIYQLSRDGDFRTLHAFTDGAAWWDPGLGPNSTTPMRPSDTFLTHASDGWLYGTRCDGGAQGQGSLFRLDPSSTDPGSDGYEPLHSSGVTSPDDVITSCPHGPLLESTHRPGTFLGTAMGGTLRDAGAAFRFEVGHPPVPLWQPGSVLSTSRYTEPVGALVERPDGAIFSAFTEWNPEYQFTYGGVARSPASGGVSRAVQFLWGGPHGPASGLVQGPSSPSGTFTLYGTTPAGGISGYGTVYKVTVPATGSATVAVLRSFRQGPLDGQGPRAELVRGPGGVYYGTTAFGGQYGYGTVFALGADEQVVTIHHFDHADGANPETQLVAGSDGNVYGVTGAGGPGGGGVLFRLNLVPVVEIGGGPHTVAEGSSVTLVASAADPQGDSALQLAWDFDGDGAFDDGTGDEAVFTADRPSRDGNGQYDVAVRVTDPTGLTATATTTVTVSNVAPSVSIVPPSLTLLVPGESAAFSASFSDPGPDSWRMHVDYGDGAVEDRTPSGPGSLALAHTYAAPGSYEVVVTVTDDDGASGQAVARAHVGSPQANITWLIGRVEGLIGDGTLKLGQGKSLVGKLELALYMLEYGNTKKAITMLEAFIQEVQAFRNAGILEEPVADQLIAIARAAIASLAG